MNRHFEYYALLVFGRIAANFMRLKAKLKGGTTRSRLYLVVFTNMISTMCIIQLCNLCCQR
jgi:hypothetical protein